MAEEIDPTTLPLEERLAHKVWKVRLGAYEELSKQFQLSQSEQEASSIIQSLDLVKKILLDTNVVAQETAYKVFIDYLTYGGNAQLVSRLVKNQDIVHAICEKGLSSSRKGTKDNAIESILLMVELLPDPSPIVEEMIPSLGNKLPKLVAGCTTCLTAIYENFGCKVVPPKLIIGSLAKLFAHADKNVRLEATKLTVELYKWMGDSLSNILFSDLKPVQQKDLTASFEIVKGEKPEQKRLTRAQKAEIVKQEEAKRAAAAAAAANNDNNNNDEDVDMNELEASEASNYDPLEFVDPVEVLDKLPNNFRERISSTKWKDRVEVLEEVLAILEKAPKLVTTDDYAPVLRIFAKNMKDANIQVVQLAATCANLIAIGLGSHFSKYQSILLGPVIERTKEKKPSVANALDTLLDTMFSISGLGSILDETVEGMKLKVPQNKIACANFLQRCLARTTVAPKSSEVDSIIEAGVKLLSDSQEPIRQAATELIGTLMKITGERQLTKSLENVDDNRKAKIMKFYETVNVKCTATAPAVAVARNQKQAREGAAKKVPSRTASSANELSSSASSSTIPAKRGAASPAKRVDDSKVSNLGKGLTARSLAKPTIPSLRPPQSRHTPPVSATYTNSPPQPFDGTAFGGNNNNNNSNNNNNNSNNNNNNNNNNKQREEIEQLKSEIKATQQKHQEDQNLIKQLEALNESLKEEIISLKSRLESENRSHSITINHKETQLNNLRIELEKANYKIKNLEQENEISKLQQSNKSFHSNGASSRFVSSGGVSKFNPPDINSGVKRLSIGGEEQQIRGENSNFANIAPNSYHRPLYNTSVSTNTTTSTNAMDVDSGDDWKRAAEVTSQLKARIERMKARARTPLNVE
ncbi:hypothetical protein KGF56_000232 [Candida oxycetoniae]|uniref:TOG domain-containing protein n=1 Tax=Candida oxycetoniae TaxID=497107 RepID=A0AAI9X0B0_9ASCO|nr:uncharacterized protein KGF56_000232 [Candida oxycetoniae]KAI3406939.2 hypothetical protein KGF56_000232 [Candida oxycetoniae]